MYYDSIIIGPTTSCIVKIGYSLFSKSNVFLGAHIHKKCVHSFHKIHKGLKYHSCLSLLDYLLSY